MRTKHAHSIRLGIAYAREALALGLIPDCRDFYFVEALVAGPKNELTIKAFYGYLIRRGFFDLA